MKYYVALVINKDNPREIYGMDDWGKWLKGRVYLWDQKQILSKGEDPKAPNGDFANERAKEKRKWLGVLGRQDWKGKMTLFNKRYTKIESKDFCPHGRSSNEYMWVWVKHYAQSPFRRLQHNGFEEDDRQLGGNTRNKFKLLVCRLGSKNCPITVDFSQINAFEKGIIKKISSDDWKRPRFTVKKI